MKKAFSLIEMIMTIVIIGIAVTAVPVIIMQTSTNVATSLQQEVIFRIKSKIAYILSADWDANSYSPTLGRTVMIDIFNDISSKEYFGSQTMTTRKRETHGGLKGLSSNAQQFHPEGTKYPVAHGNFKTPPNADQFYAIHHFHEKDEKSEIKSENFDHVFNLTLKPEIFFANDKKDYNDADINYASQKIENFPFTTSNGEVPTHIKMIQVKIGRAHV